MVAPGGEAQSGLKSSWLVTADLDNLDTSHPGPVDLFGGVSRIRGVVRAEHHPLTFAQINDDPVRHPLWIDGEQIGNRPRGTQIGEPSLQFLGGIQSQRSSRAILPLTDFAKCFGLER